MEYAIFVFTGLAILHFWYEAIYAPSKRLEIRFKLFELRDEARMLKIKYGKELDDKHFQYLQESLNGLIRHLYNIDLVLLVALSIKVHEDKEFKKRMEANAKALEGCNVPEAREIIKRGAKLVERAVNINSGGWIFYVVPIAIAFACYRMTAKLIRFICAMPEHELDKIAKPTTAAGLAR